MPHLWIVKVEKLRGYARSHEFHIVAANELDAIRKAKREAHRRSGWSPKSYTCVEMKKSDIPLV